MFDRASVTVTVVADGSMATATITVLFTATPATGVATVMVVDDAVLVFVLITTGVEIFCVL